MFFLEGKCQRGTAVALDRHLHALVRAEHPKPPCVFFCDSMASDKSKDVLISQPGPIDGERVGTGYWPVAFLREATPANSCTKRRGRAGGGCPPAASSRQAPARAFCGLLERDIQIAPEDSMGLQELGGGTADLDDAAVDIWERRVVSLRFGPMASARLAGQKDLLRPAQAMVSSDSSGVFVAGCLYIMELLPGSLGAK